MGRVVKVRHMGNDYKMHIPYAANADGQQHSGTTISDYGDLIYDYYMTDPIANQWVFLWAGGNPWGGVPSWESTYQSFTTGHFSTAWEIDDRNWHNNADGNRILLNGNGHFINPDNGRYFEVSGSLGNETIKVYDENDIQLFSGQLTTNNAWKLYGITNLHAFITAPDATTALQHSVSGASSCVISIGQNRYASISSSISLTPNNCGWLAALWYWFGGTDSSEEPSDDPYSGDDGSYNPGGTGGGDGDDIDPYDEGDQIDYPDDPDIGLCDSGLSTLYTPSMVQLNLFASFLWSTNFFQSIIKDIFPNPLDSVMTIGILPFNIMPAGVKQVKVASVLAEVGLEDPQSVMSNYPESEWYNFDCGSVGLPKNIGCYLDYHPYTKVTLYVPFVGHVVLDTDYFIGRSVQLKYKINLPTGSAVAYIMNGRNVVAAYNCNLKIEVPITAVNAMEQWKTFLGVVAAAATFGVAAGAGAVSAGMASEAAGTTGVLSSSYAEASEAAGEVSSKAFEMGKNGLSSSNISNSLSLKPQVSKSNIHGVSGGFVGSKLKPYLVVERPNLQIPSQQASYMGYPSFITKKLSECLGYTQVDSCKLSLPKCTSIEANMIDHALKNGVIITTNRVNISGIGVIALCRKKSPVNQIGIELEGNPTTISGNFHQEVSIENPIIRVEVDNVGVIREVNYIYVEYFKRWYFVDNIKFVRVGLYDIHCTVDPLNSFIDDILDNTCIISKQEKDYNLYLNDDSLKVLQNPLISCWEFPHGFGEGYEYVMVCAGA